MENDSKNLRVIIISDGTGETAASISNAAITQFPDCNIIFTRYKNVRTEDQIESILTEASIHHDIVLHTVVQEELRNFIKTSAKEKDVPTLDLIGPALNLFSEFLRQTPTSQPGLLHSVDEKYFNRVAAMEFTLMNDDGKNIKSIHEADVILVGISRTSKTPLSVYLSQHGIKVINIPIIPGTDLPKELFEIDQRKIFGLTIDPDALIKIRQNRLSKLGAIEHTENYADKKVIIDEIEWANDLFKKNKRWPVYNVTNRALEETATDILKIINMRKKNQSKQAR